MNIPFFNTTKTKEVVFERTYEAPIAKVWQAWTEPEMLKQWWGPAKTFIPECKIDLRVGGEVYIVMEACEEMGKYKGTKWPLQGNYTVIEPTSQLAYTAKSWTEGTREKTEIDQTSVLSLSEDGEKTVMKLVITLNSIAGGAGMAVMGMKWGYKMQFDKLEKYLGKQ